VYLGTPPTAWLQLAGLRQGRKAGHAEIGLRCLPLHGWCGPFCRRLQSERSTARRLASTAAFRARRQHSSRSRVWARQPPHASRFLKSEGKPRTRKEETSIGGLLGLLLRRDVIRRPKSERRAKPQSPPVRPLVCLEIGTQHTKAYLGTHPTAWLWLAGLCQGKKAGRAGGGWRGGCLCVCSPHFVPCLVNELELAAYLPPGALSPPRRHVQQPKLRDSAMIALD
jgi:hypothetical protein